MIEFRGNSSLYSCAVARLVFDGCVKVIHAHVVNVYDVVFEKDQIEWLIVTLKKWLKKNLDISLINMNVMNNRLFMYYVWDYYC